MKFKYAKYWLIGLVVILFFTTCRKYKYPESTYKGADPGKFENCPFYGKLTAYTVNGIDSLDLLINYVDTAFKLSYPLKMRDCEFRYALYSAHEIDIFFGPAGYGLGTVDYEFSKDRKKIKIYFGFVSKGLKRNLFISLGLDWDIIRFTNDDGPFKIRKTLDNGNTYEIQIR